MKINGVKIRKRDLIYGVVVGIYVYLVIWFFLALDAT